MNNQIIITQTLSKNQIKKLIGENDNRQSSFNHLKLGSVAKKNDNLI